MHLERALAPALRKADIALFLPAKVFLTDARTVTAKRLGISLAGIRRSKTRERGFLTVCSR
jgi:hypothetical protein